MAHQADPAEPAPGARLDDGAFSAAVAAVTAAFGDPTRRDIYLFARDAAEGVTAGEVATKFALHPNVARHHLDKLAAGGYLEVHVERKTGAGSGRPSKRYRGTAKSATTPFLPTNDDLLVLLLARLLSLVPPGLAEATAEEVGEEYGRTLAAQMAPGDHQRSFRAALTAVADALTAHGFAAHAEPRGRSLAIISDHCPFGAAASQHPVMCAIDRGMVKGMLSGLYGETDPSTESSRALGDDACVTTLT